MNIRLMLYLSLLFFFTACSSYSPQHDEVIPLVSGQDTAGCSSLRTQTLWTDRNGSEVIAMQVIKINGHQAGVKYMYQNDFRKLPYFPKSCSFGKRTYVLLPGEYDLVISYSGKGRYLVGSMNMTQNRLISYKATIPPDSTCALVSEINDFKVDLEDPKIKLRCREKRSGGGSFTNLFF